jgi:hypothetical protein
MSRVRPAPTNLKRPPQKDRTVSDHLSVSIENIDAGVFTVAEVDAIERLMHEKIDQMLARSMAMQKAPLHPSALPTRRHRDSNR